MLRLIRSGLLRRRSLARRKLVLLQQCRLLLGRHLAAGLRRLSLRLNHLVRLLLRRLNANIKIRAWCGTHGRQRRLG